LRQVLRGEQIRRSAAGVQKPRIHGRFGHSAGNGGDRDDIAGFGARIAALIREMTGETLS
jgi:hypothetical protein